MPIFHDKYNMTDIIVMCMRDGDFKTLNSFVDNLESIDQYIYLDNDNRLNLLHLAAGLDSNHREEVIELLISKKVDLNRSGCSDSTNNIRALHLAAMWGYDLTVKLLLFHGADASLRDSNGMLPSDYATIFDNYSCKDLLLKYGNLNSSSSAWSAILDSSLGESVADSSFENCLYLTALDINADERDRWNSNNNNNNNSNNNDNNKSSNNASNNGNKKTNDSKNQPVLNNVESKTCDKHSHVSILSDIEDEDEDYDPLDSIKEEDIDLAIDNRQLRSELRKLGRHAGPITDTTKRLYCKLLVRLAKEDKELVYSPRTTSKSQLNGYSIELNSILTGKFSTKQALELEKEFIRISGSKPYHGPKQFFNYILIDPRISQNLPELALEASDSDTSRMLSPDIGGDHHRNGHSAKPKYVMGRVNRRFNPKFFVKFIESIFYIGKGQKKRDLVHLYDALADRESITHKKIERIRSIWADGYGVVSLHLFHNITDKEALTREALMIEAIGLNNLTNLLRGTIQFKLGWSEHHRKLLGSLLIHRAYTQFLNEGERQIRKDDLKSDQRIKK